MNTPAPPDPLRLIAAGAALAVCALLLLDTLAPNTITAPRIAGAPIANTLAD